MTKAESFRPLTGDLSSLQDGEVFNEPNSASFRPLTGDLSSLRPFSGLFTSFSRVSVPLQGTYLPYPVRATHEFPYASTALCVGKRK